jgi:DNA-binding PucR family transcriptional regulator
MVDEQQVDVPEVHPGLLRLLRADGGRVLAQTLETYLDLAGNAHATAERLRLHRTTLYYRLQRVEQLAGTNLKDGNERLTLHLALKLAQLSSVS